MIEAGLLVAGDDIPVPYDRFRDRVMFPISDLARPRHRVRRPRARQGRAGQISQLAGDAALPQGRDALQRRGRARRRPRGRAGDRGRGLCRRDRHGDGGLRGDGRAARHRAHRGPARRCCGRWPTSRSSASTATRPAGAPPIGRSTSRCRCCGPARACASPRLPDGQDPDDLVRSGGRGAIADVLAGARPLAEMLWMRETEAGALRHAGAARRARGAHRRGHDRRSATNRCANIIARISRRGCAACSRREPAGRRAPGAAAAFRKAAARASSAAPAGRRRDRPAGGRRRRRSARGRPASPRAAGPIWSRSPQLAASPIQRGDRAAISRREALILLAALNHPWLLHDHLEEIAELEFRIARRRAGARSRCSTLSPMGALRTARACAAELAGAGSAEPVGAHREAHHHRVGLGRRGRTRRRRTC